MPLYTYCCPAKHTFDRIVSVDKRDDLQPCPHTKLQIDAMELQAFAAIGTKLPLCEQLATRVGIELNAKSFPGADSWRKR